MRSAGHAIDDYVDLLLTPADGSGAPSAAPSREREAQPAPPADPAPDAAGTAPAAGLRIAASAGAPDPADAPPPPEPADEHLARWLRLRCGHQTYALELLKIREVVLPAPLLPLRGAGKAVIGVMNLRGQVVPVLDLGLHFSGAAIEPAAAVRIIVLENRNEVLGLRVSAVEDIVLLDETRIEDARSSHLAPVGDQRIRGIARFDERIVLLLDAGRLLATPLH